MLDDLRHHDAKPTDEEKAWMLAGAHEMALRSGAVLLLAVIIGVSASYLIESPSAAPVVAQGVEP